MKVFLEVRPTMHYTDLMGKKDNKSLKFILVNDRKPSWYIALRFAFLYSLFGFAWIFFSDSAVMTVIQDHDMLKTVAMVKGFVYVFLSAAFIILITVPTLKRLGDKEQMIRENRDELKVLVYYDHLTGLQNRRKLFERLPDFLKETKDSNKALLYIDIDNTGLINDTLGHAYGNLFITAIAGRLSAGLPKGDELYRLGDDEFIILTRFERNSEIHDKAASINALFSAPLSIQDVKIHSSISMGIALYPFHNQDPWELMKCADIALTGAKKEGKNRSTLFNLEMMVSINERMKIGEQLHSALDNGEFELYFQPQIRLETGRVVSMEALLRWTNPILGKVSPDSFITVAEETHLIIPMGIWVLETACGFLKRMHGCGYANLTVSVNVSMIQLMDQDFPAGVRKILEKSGLDPRNLELEITESVLMESHNAIKRPLDELKAIGVVIALDDFGKGYSSLSYLEQLPISVLKIDKIFIDGIKEDSPGNSITGNIVGIGKKLGLEVIAEGVETESQLKYLAGQHCDKIQGWIYSKALPMIEAERFIRENLDGAARG